MAKNPATRDTKTPEAENLPAVVAPSTSSNVPAYLQGTASGSQLAGIDQSDVALPSIRLLQAVSPVVGAFDDAVPGIFWHTGFDMALGESIDFIICANRKKYLLMAPLTDGRGVLARAEDGVHWQPSEGDFEIKIKNVKKPVTWTLRPTVEESGLAQFGTFNPEDPDSPPAAVLMYEHLVILPEFPDLGPTFLTFARSQVKKVRRELYPKVMMHGNSGRPMQALRFRATTVEEQGAEGPYFNVKFTSAGWANEAEFKMAVDLQERFGRFKSRDESDIANEGMEPAQTTAPAGSGEY
jgi:hypothetical protein